MLARKYGKFWNVDKQIFPLLQIWKASYGQRAKLARLLYIREKFKLDKFSIYDSLVKVQYVYHDREPAEFQCIIPVHSYDLSEFLFSVKKHVKGFELKIGNKERWKKIMKVIESANMVHEHDAGWRSRFSNTELLKELPKGIYRQVSNIRGTLVGN